MRAFSSFSLIFSQSLSLPRIRCFKKKSYNVIARSKTKVHIKRLTWKSGGVPWHLLYVPLKNNYSYCHQAVLAHGFGDKCLIFYVEILIEKLCVLSQ